MMESKAVRGNPQRKTALLYTQEPLALNPKYEEIPKDSLRLHVESDYFHSFFSCIDLRDQPWDWHLA